MGGYIFLGMLAAFGLVCAVWVLAGLLLPKKGSTLVCMGPESTVTVQRYLWLREMGLTADRMAVLDCEGLDREWLEAQGIEICSREELIRRLEMGEKEIDAGA